MAKIVTADYDLDLEHPAHDNMSDDEFFSFCAQNKNIRIERDENKQILIMSPSDRLKPAMDKMVKWIKNGVLLAWLIDPENEVAYIYKSSGTIEQISGFNKNLSGEDVLPGFELDLSILK